MKKFENLFKYLSITLLSIAVIVVVGVFSVYSNKNNNAKITDIPDNIAFTTYSGEDFYSDETIQGSDNYLKELGLSSGKDSDDFKLFLERNSRSEIGADFIYSVDVNDNGLYEAEVAGELGNLSGTHLSINKAFNESGNKKISFKIIPTKGQDYEGGSANAYYVSAIYLYTSITDTFNDVQSSVSDADSVKGKLIYPTTSIISGDVSFSFTCDNETGAIDCDLTTLNKREVLTNLKFSFQLSYRDKSASANVLDVYGETDIVHTSVENGSYSIPNDAPTFSVDDKLTIDIIPGTKILKTLKFDMLTEDGRYVELFKIHGGVAGGFENFAFAPEAVTDGKKLSINNFALGFQYTNNFLSGEVGKFTKVSSIIDGNNDLIGEKIEIAEIDKIDHRHKITVSLYDDGSVRIEKIGNECSFKLTVSTQHYFVVNLQEYSNGTSSTSREPYDAIIVSSNSIPIVSASGEDLKDTTYIGVGESIYSLELYVKLKNEYKWYKEAINASFIVDEFEYRETFGGGIKTLVAVSSNEKIAQLTISVELALNESANSRPLKKSNLEILIGETSANEKGCLGVANTGIGSKSIGMAEHETSATFSYTVKLPYGLEIFKYSIDGEETILESTLLSVKNKTIIVENNCNIVYYVKPIVMADILVYNQELDTENPIGKLKFEPGIDTVGDLKINYGLYYLDLTRVAPSYSILSSNNCPKKVGYKLIGLYDSVSLNVDKIKDNFIDTNYRFAGLSDYTGYPDWVINVTSYITYLYSVHKNNLANMKLFCIFEPVTYTHSVKSTPEPTDKVPNPSTITIGCKVTFDDNYLYIRNKLHDKTGYYVAGIYNKEYEVLFDKDVEVEYNEEWAPYNYRYKLEQPWNISKSNGVVFETLLKPITYQSTMIIAEISKYHFATDNVNTADVDESIIDFAIASKGIDFDSSFMIDDIFNLYTGNIQNKLEGYDLIGYMPISSPLGTDVVEDGSWERLEPEKEFYYIYDKLLNGGIDENVATKMLRFGENYTWKYQRGVRFVPVYQLGEYTLTLHAREGNVFDVNSTTEIDIEAVFNEELTEEFIRENFLAPFNLIAGYDFGGYYYLDENSNEVLVVGGEKQIDKDVSTIRFKATNIVKDAINQFIQDFAYIYQGKMYWGVTRDLDLEIKFNKINYELVLTGKDADGNVADMSSQNFEIFNKDLDGEAEETGISMTYGEFIASSGKVNIGNVLAIRNLGDEGTYVKTITLKYNTLFDEENYRTAYLFNFVTDKNGKMSFVANGSDNAENIYYDTSNNSFYIDINELLNREKELFGTIATIKDFLIEFEYDYRTFVIGFQTGAYGKDLTQIVTPSTADASYYLVNYKTRNDYLSWIPCLADGTVFEEYTNVWQDVSFVHNSDLITFEEGSLDRSQEIDIMIGSTPYFFCYWARTDMDGNVEPLSWDWSDGNANVANSEDGGSLIYYSVFSKTADINVYYYTWDPVAKEETGLGYVPTAQKGYFWFKENQDGSFRTVNSYERYKIGNHTYYITGWIWLEDNVADAGSFNQGVYYDKKNNMFVDSYTGSIIGSENIPDSYHELLESCTVAYRGDTDTDDTKIKIYCYAVYSLYDFEVVVNDDQTSFEIDMRVPNDFGGNSYTTDDLHWGAMSSTEYAGLLGKYLSIKDVINSGKIEVVTFPETTGKNSITSAEAVNLLSEQYDLLICYYSRDVLSETQTVVVDALGIGTLTVNGFEYDAFDKVGSYADGTIVGAIDEIVKLSGTYMTAYVNAINQMKSVGITDVEFNKRELILRITLQLLQWDASFGESTSKGIKYSQNATIVGFEDSQINVLDCIEQISNAQGGLIQVSSEGFVRLVYALAGYSVNSEQPDSAYGLFGDVDFGESIEISENGLLNQTLKCGDIIVWDTNPEVISIWLYSFQDTSGNMFSIIANCRSITSDTELCGANRSCSLKDGALVFRSGPIIYSYNKFLSYCN